MLSSVSLTAHCCCIVLGNKKIDYDKLFEIYVTSYQNTSIPPAPAWFALKYDMKVGYLYKLCSKGQISRHKRGVWKISEREVLQVLQRVV